MRKYYIAVLHLKTYLDYVSVYLLTGKVTTQLAANQSKFQNVDPTLQVVTAANTELDRLIKLVDGNPHNKQTAENQSAKVYSLLKDLASYVNKVAKGDRATILLSGFDCNEDATERDIPSKVNIKRIEDGSKPHSAKIFIETDKNADWYKVEMTTDPLDEGKMKTVLDPASSRKLEIENLTRGEEVWFKVTACNIHGWGESSDLVAFLPR